MKKSIKRLLSIGFTIALAFVLVACGSQESSEGTTTDYSPENPVTVSVGLVGDVTNPVNSQWEIIADTLSEEGIELEFTSFSDYNSPNTAVADGSLDLNAFQTQIFLDSFNESSGNEVVGIGNTTFNPLGIFSNTYSDVSEISEGDQIAVPNDASNEGRALILLQTAGLIEVDPEAGLTPVIDDIVSNPLNLDIVAIDANQTARSLEDAAATVINNDMAIDAGLIPTEDAIFLEPVDENTEPYINVIAALGEEADNPIYLRVVEAYQTQEIADHITEATNGSSIPVWE